MPRTLIEPHKGDKRYVRRKRASSPNRRTMSDALWRLIDGNTPSIK
jgi:hypothetical protein